MWFLATFFSPASSSPSTPARSHCFLRHNDGALPGDVPIITTRLSPAIKLLVACLLVCCGLFSGRALHAQGTPEVTYNPAINTIFIGSGSGAAPGSQVISLPAVATAVGNDVLSNQAGVWLSTARIVVDSTARLEVRQSAGVTELRLESVVSVDKGITFIQVQNGGQLLIEGVKVTSWDTTTNQVDEVIGDGRAYIVVENGSRLEVLGNSELAYLGDANGSDHSGVALIKRRIAGDPTTGPTGIIQNSKLHHNYQGLFVSEGISLTIASNEVYANLNQGLYLRDGTTAVDVTGNNVHDNGNASTGTGDGILFDNNSTNNRLLNNTVTANAGHGIVLKRNSNNNQIRGNTIAQNSDGIAIDDADNNLVQNNALKNNQNGIRVSGSTDNPAAGNQLLGNTIEDSTSDSSNAYGIYFYSHADSNLIRNNTILRSATYGIYLKSGGNQVEGNVVNGGKTGIAIVGEAESIGQIPLLVRAGSANTVISNTIEGNSDIGIRIEGGVGNGIGANPTSGAPLVPNIVQNNGGNGIFIKNTSSDFSSTDNQVVGNRVHNNGGAGIVVKDSGSDRNRLSHNSVTGNAGSGIKVDGGAQAGIQPPVIEDVLADGNVLGTAVANATIEVYSDPGSEGETLLGSATTDENGAWRFQLPAGQDSKRVTAIVIDGNGNTSAFSGVSGSAVELFTTVTTDEQSQTVININGPGAVATLSDIQTLLGATNANLLQNQGNGVWQLNANLKLEREVTLNISPETGVSELKLRSSNSGTISGTVDYSSFVYIRTHNGVVNIDGVKIYGWDESANAVDTNMANGRAFIIAKYGAELNIRNAELSYLGTNESSESYGVTWRDDVAVNAAGFARTQVTGSVENSKFHHNFVGAQVIQAGDMTFTGNEFHSNANYGFYARNDSRDIVLNGNLVHENASHGIFLARGITNVTVRNNKSYNNGNGAFAHGIVISEGSPPRRASVENLLEGNEVYGNGGYGINIEGSNKNEVRNNTLYNNEVGLNVEDGSTDNHIHNNSATANSNHGFQLRQTSNGNRLLDNVATENGSYGFYVRSDNNRLENNRANSNLDVGITVKPESATALQDNQLISNTVQSNASHGIDIRGSVGTTVTRNRIEGNGVHGLYLTDGAVGTVVAENIIALNNDTGIRVNDLLSYQNRWTANAIYANKNMGINIAGGANNSIPRPKITAIEGRYVKGSVNVPGATIEIFTDSATQGRHFVGRDVADSNGKFNVVIGGSFIAPGAVAVATDTQGNSSEFSDTVIVEDLNPAYIFFLPIVAR